MSSSSQIQPIPPSSPPPKADHDAQYLKEIRESLDESLRDMSTPKDKVDQLISIQSFAFKFIKDAACQSPNNQEVVQQGLDVLWHTFCGTAQVLDKDDPVQDKLISLLLWVKEYDSLYKTMHPTEAAGVSWESYGFTDGLRRSWEQLLTTGTVSQQCGLAAFSGKLLASGICQDSIAPLALWFLNVALEMDDEERTTALLPAATVWMEQCSHKLLTLSATGREYRDVVFDLQPTGLLVEGWSSAEPVFGMPRWLFWRRRFQELSRHTDAFVAQEAKKAFMSMIFCGRHLGCDVPGEANFSEKLQKAMWEELVRSGKESVAVDEIDVDVDWVKGSG